MLVARKDVLEKLPKPPWLISWTKFPVEDSKQGLAKTRPAMTIIVQQAYYIDGGPTTQKVKINKQTKAHKTRIRIAK